MRIRSGIMQLPASLRSDFIHIASELTIHIAGIRTDAQHRPINTVSLGHPDGISAGQDARPDHRTNNAIAAGRGALMRKSNSTPAPTPGPAEEPCPTKKISASR